MSTDQEAVSNGGTPRIRRASSASALRVSSDLRGVGSLGLGLVLVRRIADAHKGRLEIANRDEGGARFVVSVPAPGA